MNNWIEINLPWCVNLKQPKLNYPDMENLIEKHFGFTEDSLHDKYFPNSNKYNFLANHPVFVEFQKIESKIISQMHKDANYNSFSKELANRLAASNNQSVNTVLTYRKLLSDIRAWVDCHPVWIAAKNKNDKICAEHNERRSKLSFCGRGLNMPGTVIEFQQNKELKQLLIGDMDVTGGHCGEYPLIEDDQIVLRYQKIWPRY